MHEYTKDPTLNLFTRSDFCGIAYSDGIEVEKRILEAMCATRDRSVFSLELAKHITDWPTEYHFSRQRHNLVRPLGIQADDKVLELGCGCGAITRYLGEIGANVTAVDGNLTRARIAATRCVDLPNVRVIAEELMTLNLYETFDWVLLIGVLEYAPVFSNAPAPAHDYIKHILQYLSPEGRLVIAIENKLGLKYFNACGEDHLGIPFIGIQGLYSPQQPRTYGRKELSSLLTTAGFESIQYFYPFPDYKLPRILFSQAGLDDTEFAPGELLATMYARDYGNCQHRLFDDPLVLREFSKNDLIGDLCHSFLAVATRERPEIMPTEILATTYTSNRCAQFATETRFVRVEGKIRAIKQRLYPHLKAEADLDKWTLQHIEQTSDYIHGSLAIWPLVETRARGGSLDAVVDALSAWLEFVLSKTDGHGKHLSDYQIPGDFLDLTPFNLIETEHGFCPFDQEWRLDGPIPLGWLVFRTALNILVNYPGFEKQPMELRSVITALCSKKGLSFLDADLSYWAKLEAALQSVVTGENHGPFPITVKTRRHVPLYIRVNEQNGQIRSLQNEKQLLEKKCKDFDISMMSNEKKIQDLSSILADRDSQLEDLNNALSQRKIQVHDLKKSLAERNYQVHDLTQALADRDREFQCMSKQISRYWQLPKPSELLRKIAVRKSVDKILSRSRFCKIIRNNLFTYLPYLFYKSHSYIQWKKNYFPFIKNSEVIKNQAKIIAFYLPQFHIIPENEQWWGKGFTEWTKVKSAQPQFEGHYQPHVPGELGYYNLLDSDIQSRQVRLAKKYGLGGFCFYFYWFAGKTLLEQPIINFRNNVALDFSYCLCWANENWTRRWDGNDQEILIGQEHSAEDDLRFIDYISTYLKDDRYIKVDGKPLLVVYRPSLLPSAKDTAKRWREWCLNNGIGSIYLAYTQSFEIIDPNVIGFDAAIEFPPNNSPSPIISSCVKPSCEDFECKIYDWNQLYIKSKNYTETTYPIFRSACPSWDNTPRRNNMSSIQHGSSPELFQDWLENAIKNTHSQNTTSDKKLIFINAWNEWGEGAHLEPDMKYGYAWLQAVRDAQVATDSDKVDRLSPIFHDNNHNDVLKARWERIQTILHEKIDRVKYSFLCNSLQILTQLSNSGCAFSYEKNTLHYVEEGDKSYIENKTQLIELFTKKIVCEQPKIFCFIILQHNFPELTERCINSIKKIIRDGYEIYSIIVDNGSTEESTRYIDRKFASDTSIKIIYSDKNLGFSKGNNLGYEFARNNLKASFIAIINNDTYIDDFHFLKKCINEFYEWGYSVLGPRITVDGHRHENPWNNHVFCLNELRYLNNLRKEERQQYSETGHAEFKKIGHSSPLQKNIINPMLQGAALIFSPVFLMNNAKAFDDRLFLYGEEFLLAQKCWLSGHLMLYSSDITIAHEEGRTTHALDIEKKYKFGYDSIIYATQLCIDQLHRHKQACSGIPVNLESDDLRNLLGFPGPHVLVDLLFCQPGYHGGGEYGKSVFKELAKLYAVKQDFQLWVALNSELYIDSWVLELCKNYAINIIHVPTYYDIIKIVNMDVFSSFFTPAIVVYTGYEYMKTVGSRLSFTNKKTRVIGTLLDIRDYELFLSTEKIINFRKKLCCIMEEALTTDDISKEVDRAFVTGQRLLKMYHSIIHDEQVDTLVTISSYCKESIHRHIGIPNKLIHVSMPPMKHRPTPEPFPKDHNLHFLPAKFALLVNASRPEKNAASAILAFDGLFLSDEYLPILQTFSVIVLGASCVEETGLQSLSHADKFYFLPVVPAAQYEFLMKNADFLVYPSLNEGFGYPPLEAMSHGTKCIASDIPSLREVYQDSLMYFDPFDISSIKSAIIDMINKNYPDKISERYAHIINQQQKDLESLCNLIINQ